MSLRFLCIEIRRQLHCANVFLQFDESLTETEFLKINIEEDALRLREYSTESKADVAKFFKIEARTISNLTIEESNASFRLSINDIQEEESQELSVEKENASGDGVVAPSAPSSLKKSEEKQKTDVLLLNIEEKAACLLLCGNCEMSLTPKEEQIFDRLREFPSGTIDVSEFFCHHHDHHGTNFSQLLVPNLNDLFYGFLFIILSSDLIQTKVKFKDNHIYCKRCLKYLGELLYEGKAAKIWSDFLKCKKSTDSEQESLEIFNINKERTLNELLLHKILKEFTFNPEHLSQNFSFTKIILESTFPNRKPKYLLIQLIENNLEILRNTRPLAHGSHNNNNILNIPLERWLCFKLNYRFVDPLSLPLEENDGLVLLNLWHEDVNIHSLKISHGHFNQLLHELEENSLLFPEAFRFVINDFQMSYIFYEKQQ